MELLPIESPEKRYFYARKIAEERWNVRHTRKFDRSQRTPGQEKTDVRWKALWKCLPSKPNNSKHYQPDFVVETPDVIYLVETKKEKDLESQDVRDKSRAAQEYCRYASEFTRKHGGKEWGYVLTPHGVVRVNMGLETLVRQYEQ